MTTAFILLGIQTVGAQSFRLSDYSSLGNQAINSITQSSPNIFWLGTYDGVYRLNTAHDSLSLTKPIDGYGEHISNHLFLDPKGQIWSVGRNQLSVYTDGQWEQRQSLNTYQIVKAAFDSHADLWIAYGSQMSPRVLHNSSSDSKTYSLSSGQIRDLLVDSKNRVWVAGKNGISRITGNQVDLINQTDNGASLYELQSMTRDGNGFIWVISTFGDLFRLDPDSSTVTLVNKQTPLNQSYHLVSQSQQLWAASKQRICRFSDGKWSVYPQWELEPDTDILDLYINQEGGLMVGTTKGLIIHNLSNAD
ncbi:MAG: ligand-binding sensor domain-containing protein [Bacteroidota bacterium]